MKLASLLLLTLATGPALAQTAGAPDPAAAPPSASAPAVAAPVQLAQPAPSAAPVQLAQPAQIASASAEDPTRNPGFPVIDRIDGRSRIGIDVLGIVFDDSFADSSLVLFHAMAHARYVDPATGLGGYAQLPFSYLAGGGDGGGTRSDIGGPEIGVIYAAHLAGTGFGAVLHAGLALPLGESAGASQIGTLAGLLAMPDIYSSLPGATTLKIGVSPVLRSGSLFARLDFGIDWSLSNDGGALGKAFHVNAGLGVDLGRLSLAFESENTTVTPAAGGQSGTIDAVAVSARFADGDASPYVALTLPVDDDLRGITMGITAGIDVRL